MNVDSFEQISTTRASRPHIAYMALARELYLFRVDYFNRVDAFFSDSAGAKRQNVVCITGPSGAGKSSFLANWVHYRILASNSIDWVLPYFVGALGATCSLRRMLVHLISEIRIRFDIPEAVPRDDASLIQNFPFWLHVAAYRCSGHFYLVIDGIDGLIYDCAESLSDWLPEATFRQRAKTHLDSALVLRNTTAAALSAIEAGKEAADAVSYEKVPSVLLSMANTSPVFKVCSEKRKWPVMEIEPINLDAKKLLIQRVVEMAGTVYVNDREVALLVESTHTANPAVLIRILEELWQTKVSRATLTWSIDK